jgi:hypothetical protein
MPAQYQGGAAAPPNAVRGGYGGNPGAMPSAYPQQQQQQPQPHPGYAPVPHQAGGPLPSGNPGDSSQHVQNIMAQLARYRQ